MERIKVGIVEDEMIIADTICLALQNATCTQLQKVLA